MTAPVPVICSYCGVGCNLELTLDAANRPIKSGVSGRNPEVNDRYACIKGASLHEMLASPERLTQPLVRRGKDFAPVGWDAALDHTAQELGRIRQKYGPGSIGMLCSGKILNEEAYLSQKFQRVVIGNNHVDNCARLCHGPSEAALRMQLGFGAVSTYLEDFNATETVVVVGAHTSATYPVIWMKLRKRARAGEINLVVADPRVTDLTEYANVHLQPRPGTDIYWLGALARVIMAHGWHDQAFCTRQTIGFAAYRASLEALDIDSACQKSGVAREALEATAALMQGRKVVFIWGMGLTQHVQGTDNVSALVNLALLTGNIGKRGCGVSPLRGQNNVQGACDMGALPNVLPGHMLLSDAAARLHVGALWQTVLPAAEGLSAPQMIHEIAERRIRALYVIGENPVRSEPQSNFVAWMMQRLELLIVQDIFPTETATLAHVVLPAATVGEKEGTYTNAARRIQFSSQGVAAPGQARPDWWIIQELANRLGQEWRYTTTADIWAEVRQVAPIFHGVSHARLKQSHGIFWPCYDSDDEGTPRLYEDGFAFRDHRARFMPVSLPDYLMEATAEYPFVLITARLLAHFNTGVMSRRAPRLMKASDSAFVAMHPQDGARLGLADGTPIRVTSPYGAVDSLLKISETVTPGYLFAPNHFNEPNFNALMSAGPLDPKARMPALKVIPVKVAAL